MKNEKSLERVGGQVHLSLPSPLFFGNKSWTTEGGDSRLPRVWGTSHFLAVLFPLSMTDPSPFGHPESKAVILKSLEHEATSFRYYALY